MSNRVLGNRYELLEKIGGGGMAVVYKAKCQLLNRYVAVKILRDEFTNDEEFVKRFRIEAQAAASLSHPNIVSIFDVGHEENVHFIVMEYVDGITLKEYVAQKGALGWREAAGIAIQICSAIEQAHKNHIIHRDIKPHNILMTKEGIAKVTDFGIARAVSSTTITMVGSTIGSVHYFSPEQGRGGFTDEKSDLYSLGITIYEMVTGRVPFDGESPVAVALKHIQEKAERPQDINPKVPGAINDIVMKAMKKDQNQRYQSASEFLADLHRAVRNPEMKLDNTDKISDFPTKKMAALDKFKYEENLKYVDEITAEDDEENMPRKKKDRLSVWLGIITGIIIVSIFGYIGFRIVIPAMMPTKPEEFIVSNYAKEAFDLVKEQLKSHNIEAVEDRRVYNDEVDKGFIISQDIAPNMPLAPGSQIKFTVSDGPKMVTIPNVAKKEYRLAEQNLKDLELVTKLEYEYSDEIATGLIVKTEPGAEEEVKPGSEVILYVSQGPELKLVKVPSLVGLQRAEAERLIQENGLSIGKRTPEDIVSDTALIINQYPLAETEVNEGTAVELTYDVESQTSIGDDATKKTGSGENTSLKYKPWDVVLDNPDKYEDEIHVYIEATPSGMDAMVVIDKKIPKSSFPISVDIPVTTQGLTYVLVEYNGVRIYESSI